MDAFGMVEESAALIFVENVQQKLELLGISRFDESPFLSSQAKLLHEALRQSCKTSHKLHVFEELLSDANFDVPLNFIWERLHTGHWSSVSVFWRESYSYFAVLKSLAMVKFCQDEIGAVKILDYGLILGGDLGSNILTNLAQQLHDTAVHKHSKLDASDCIIIEANLKGEGVPDITVQNENIIKISQPSVLKFLDLIETDDPFVILDSMNHWRALSCWSINYILCKAKYRHVPIELGSKYNEENWTQTIMPLHQFVAEYFTANAQQKGYLAQHDFLTQVPCLRDDISIPDYCFMTPDLEGGKVKNEIIVNSWFGPGGTVSPLHQDPRRNLLCQVFGRKYIVLIPASESEFVYPATDDPLLLNTSQVDIENPDLDQFPLFTKARQIRVILSAGEMIYIPPKCWHFVKSLDPSFSISFWFD